MNRCMNEGDIIIYGAWLDEGDGYGEYFGIVDDINRRSIDLTFAVNGEAVNTDRIEHVDDVVEGQNYWRSSTPKDFTDQSPVSGQVVWVSYAREESCSKVVQGIVLTSPEPFGGLIHNLRVVFRTRRTRTRTLLPQSQATACDSFWATEEPSPVYCDDDD